MVAATSIANEFGELSVKLGFLALAAGAMISATVATAAPITFAPEIHVEQPATTLKAELSLPDVVEETTVVRERPDDPTSPIRKLIKRITRKENTQ